VPQKGLWEAFHQHKTGKHFTGNTHVLF